MKIKKDMRSMKMLPTQFREMESKLLQDSFGSGIYHKYQPMNSEEIGKNTHLILKKDATPQFDFLIETLIELFHGLSLASNQGNVTIHETKVYSSTIQKIKNEMHLHQYDNRVQQVDVMLDALLRENFSTVSVGNALPVLENYIKKNVIYKQVSQTKNGHVEQNSFQRFIENHINHRTKNVQNLFLDTQWSNEWNEKRYDVEETFIQKLHVKNNLFLPAILREKNNFTNMKKQYYLTGHADKVYRMERIGTGISEGMQLWLAENQGQQLLEKSLVHSLKTFYLQESKAEIQRFLSGNPTVFEGVVRSFYEKSATYFHEMETQTEKIHEDFREKIHQSTEKSMASILHEIANLQTEKSNTIHTKTQMVMPIHTARLGGVTLREAMQSVGAKRLQIKSVTHEMIGKTTKVEMVNHYFNRYLQSSFQRLWTQGHFIKREKENFRHSDVISSTTLVNRLHPQSDQYATFHELHAYLEVTNEQTNVLNELKNQVAVQNGIWQMVNRNQLEQTLSVHHATDLKTAIQNYDQTQRYHSGNVYQHQVIQLLENQKLLEQNYTTSSMTKHLHVNQTAELTRVATSLFYESMNQNSFATLMAKVNPLVQSNQTFLNHLQTQISHHHETGKNIATYYENHSQSQSDTTHFLRALLHKNFFVGGMSKSDRSAMIYENNLYFSKTIPQNDTMEIAPNKMVESKIVQNTISQLTNQVASNLHMTMQKQEFNSVMDQRSIRSNEVKSTSQTRNEFWNYAYDMHHVSTIFEVLQNESLTQNAYDNRHTSNLFQNDIRPSGMQLPILQMREWQRNKLKYTREVEQQIVHKKEMNTIHTIAEIAKENSALMRLHSQTEKSVSTHIDFMKLHQTHEILQKTTKQNIVNLHENNHLFNHQKFYFGRESETFLSLDSIEKMYHNRKTSFFHTKQSEVLLHETKTRLEHKVTNEMTEKYNEFVIKKEMPPTTLEDIEVELTQFIAKTVDEKMAVLKEEVDMKQSVEAKEVAESSEKSAEISEVLTETDVERIYERVYTKIERALESERRRMGY